MLVKGQGGNLRKLMVAHVDTAHMKDVFVICYCSSTFFVTYNNMVKTVTRDADE